MSDFNADISDRDLFAAAASPRFAALVQLETDIGNLYNFDEQLARDPRLLVPVDVNALVVRAGDEPMVRLPFRTADETPPVADDPGAQRAPGVHLLWRPPASFGRGTIVPDPLAPDDPSRSTLSLPPLPDRWLVLRLCVPVGSRQPHVRGWVLRADDGTVVPLDAYPDGTGENVGPAVPAEQLNAHVGGPGWTESYDAAVGRLALHDTLDDLEAIAPAGVVGDSLTYVVGGWWDRTDNDPLDGVGSIFGYADRLRDLGWDDPDHPAPERAKVQAQSSVAKVEELFGLSSAKRYGSSSETQISYQPGRTGFGKASSKVAAVPAAPTQLTMLHGRVHGVPWRGAVTPDDRPAVGSVGVALGPTSPSVSALLASGAMVEPTSASEQADAERLLTAFNSGLLAQIADPDVWPEILHYEHLQGFGSIPGGTEAVDRLKVDLRPSVDPGSGNRLGRRSKTPYESILVEANILWSTEKYSATLAHEVVVRHTGTGGARVPLSAVQPLGVDKQAAEVGVRTAARPATPFTYPVAPVLAATGCGRRIRAAERDEADGVLRVRTSDQPEDGSDATVSGKDLIGSIGSGAVPDEILPLVREALLTDPYLVGWRADRVRGGTGYVAAAAARLRSEAVMSYAYYAGDDRTLAGVAGVEVESSVERQLVVEGLAKHATSRGVWCHPEGVTMWGQPWRPQFCEWRAELSLADLAELVAPAERGGWILGDHDLRRVGSLVGADSIELSGRSPLHVGIANGLAAAVGRWLDDERARNDDGQGVASPETEAAMADIATHLAELDVLSISLDGVREQLLGLRYDRGLVRADADIAEDGTQRALAVGLPRLVAAGRFRVVSARLVDSWGRLLELPVDRAAVVADAVDPDGGAASIQLPPRVTAPSRVHLRLIDPLPTEPSPRTAVVDQIDASLMVNPVAGFLLPDHIDEALEIFDAGGAPLGQLSHDAFSDAVYWEGAPGRVDIGPASGPLDDGDPAHRRLGWIAAGLVNADAEIRDGQPGRPEVESPLSALLRAVDTTLWSIDPFGALGTEHIAGLVGRPIAVVQAELTLDVQDDLDELVHADGLSREARARTFAELAAIPFAVRLGSLLRSDDGLLGYYVDDDYSRLHTIDRQVALHAKDTGRCRGQLGVGGTASPLVIDHDYIGDAGYVTVRHAQTRRLTLLMHPGGKVHVASGIAPRSSVALARDWVHPGLSVMAPSVRVGPLLIDADKVRLPKVSSFPADQLFTRRLSPGAWRDDPILSATQTAYLPDQPSALQEGWIRIDPNPPGEEAG